MQTIKIKHTPITAESVIVRDSIEKIYIGKGNDCRCGCSGIYYYPEDETFEQVLNGFLHEASEKDVSSSEYTYEKQGIIERSFEVVIDKEKDIVITLYVRYKL